jgi:hypothetical protein
MRTLHRVLLIAALLGAPGAALAGDVQVDLDFGTGLIFPGQAITFTGTVSNLDSSIVFLNGCDVNLTGLSVEGDCSLFLTFAPLSLDPLETGLSSFSMFTITADVPYLDSLGVQSGSFDVLGGADSSSQDLLGTVNFSVDVEAPEPSSALLLLAGCVVLALLLRPALGVQSVSTARHFIRGHARGEQF